MRILVLALLLLGASCPPASSQTATRPISRLDISASVGWFHGHHDEISEYGPDWIDTFYKGTGAGYYWTDHLKSEIEAAWAGESHAFYVTRLDAAAAPFGYIYERHYFRTVKISIDQAYQFGRNAWVHPFVAAGVDVDRERDRVERPAQNLPVLPTLPGGLRTTSIPALNTEATSVVVRPFLKAGFKVYVSERAFFLGDVKFGFGSRLEQVIWRAGLGVDF